MTCPSRPGLARAPHADWCIHCTSKHRTLMMGFKLPDRCLVAGTALTQAGALEKVLRPSCAAQLLLRSSPHTPAHGFMNVSVL